MFFHGKLRSSSNPIDTGTPSQIHTQACYKRTASGISNGTRLRHTQRTVAWRWRSTGDAPP